MDCHKLDANFKQQIELFFFYLFNGTFNLKNPLNSNFDYREKLKNSPSKLLKVCSIYIHSMGSEISKDLITEAIYEKDSKTTFDTSSVMTPENSLFKLMEDISNLPSLRYKALFDSGNDIQLMVCVWGNNIEVDNDGNVTNANYAKERAIELLNEMAIGTIPLKPFEEWELEHNT